MNLFKRRPLPTGRALIEEAIRLGVSLEGLPRHVTSTYPREFENPSNEPEIQNRVLAARAERRSSTLSLSQTFGIIGSLLLTLVLALWTGHRQSQRESADMMLKFSEMLDAGGSGDLSMELDMDGNLDHHKVSADILDKEIDDFFSKYELLAAAHRYHLINNDMAYDAFSYDLEKAMQDNTVREYITISRSTEGNDIYDGVLDLARMWGITFVPLSSVTPTAKAPH